MIDDILNKGETRMKGAIKALEEELEGIRTGRATPALVEKLTVEYFGVDTPFNQVANITIPDARSIMIKPYDPTLVRPMTKAIQASDLGLTPSDDGKTIRLMLPPLTEERRKELAKQVKGRLEEARVAIRNVRRDVVKDLKDAEKDKLITEDDRKKGEEKAQKLTTTWTAKVDEVGAKKEKEIMEI